MASLLSRRANKKVTASSTSRNSIIENEISEEELSHVHRNVVGIQIEGAESEEGGHGHGKSGKKMTTDQIRKYMLILILIVATLIYAFNLSEVDRIFIGINAFNSSHLLSQPKHYPWHEETNGPLSFGQLWELVTAEPISGANSLNTDASSFYIVSNGKLYERSSQQETKRRNSLYQGRIHQYEQLMSFALGVSRIAASKNLIDERLKTIITEPFPFYVSWGDFRRCKGKTFPFFTFPSFAKNQRGQEACLPLSIPTYEQWNRHKLKHTSSLWDRIFTGQTEKYPWSSKINKAVWRGSTTGDELVYTNWRDLPRSKLVKLSLDNPSVIDASFTANWLPQRNETEKLEIIASGFAKKSIPFPDFQTYKAIIDIDGNSWSSRFADLLCMNSVVIKVEPFWVDYFYSELQPWVHYIPVHSNMSNLVEMVNLVIADDQQQMMKQIVQQANEFCRSKLTATQMAIDMAWIMLWYIELLTKEDDHSGNFTKWKHDFSNPMMWNSSDWVEVLSSKCTTVLGCAFKTLNLVLPGVGFKTEI